VIRDSFQIRNSSDYEDFYVAGKEDVIEQINNAKDFMHEVIAYPNIEKGDILCYTENRKSTKGQYA